MHAIDIKPSPHAWPYARKILELCKFWIQKKNKRQYSRQANNEVWQHDVSVKVRVKASNKITSVV